MRRRPPRATLMPYPTLFRSLLVAGIAMLMVGYGFKVAAMPFHMWTPDAYDGAPTPVTSLMSTGVKAAAFAAFIRTFVIGLDRKSTRLNSSHANISYAVFCLK